MKNEPAFPSYEIEYHQNGDGPARKIAEGGITKREYFAVKAMQGLMASEVKADPQVFADAAIVVADALIEALEKDR